MRETLPKEFLLHVDEILTLKHSPEEWLELEKKADEYFKHNHSGEQNQYFAESGAGEALYMVCSGIRYERDKMN